MVRISILFALATMAIACGSPSDPPVSQEPPPNAEAPPAALTTKEVEPVTEATPTEHKFTNKLIDETSPYLLQHAHNPVDWYPWGEEALAKAKAENKPIFLSIGYSACHWCHVMEHESFENEEIAAYLNEHYISIKVDREERPDLDEIYMAAVQGMTGSGGWPMTVFLTPDLEPFYGGTYYPPEDRYGRPGFLSLLKGIQDHYVNKPEDVSKQAEQLTAFVKRALGGRETTEGELSTNLVDTAVGELLASYDSEEGGFGGAPKFPNSAAISILLRHHARTGEPRSLEAATNTLDRMFMGGMYDHLGGAFHRYSVDAQWLVPHFEKMLYDNGQLAQVYLDAYQLTSNEVYARVAREIFTYQLRDMTDAGGAFHSTEDADSEGEEGKFYIWTLDEVMEVLGEEDGKFFGLYYAVRAKGNFQSHEPYHKEQNILHLTRTHDEIATELEMTPKDLEAKIAPMREQLFAHREQRVHPGLDDKVLTSWNGLMIAALARGHQVLGDEEYREAAERAADFVLSDMMVDGVLMRSHRKGETKLLGYLDDYAFMTVALIDLYEATFDTKWLDAADTLAADMVTRFWDEEDGGFFFTTTDHKDLLARTKPTYDGAEPSGNSIATLALLRLAKLTDNAEYYAKAERVLRLRQEDMASMSAGHFRMILAADFYLYAPKEIALAGKTGSDDLAAMVQAIHGMYIPNKVLAHVDPDSDNAEQTAERIPLLAQKTLQDGTATAYVCKDFACQAPVTTPEALQEQLRESIGEAKE